MRKLFCLITGLFLAAKLFGQDLNELVFDYTHPFQIKELKTKTQSYPVSLHLFSIEINGRAFNDDEMAFTQLQSDLNLHLLIDPDGEFKKGYKTKLIFSNNGKSIMRISNIIPFGRNDKYYYISGKALADIMSGREPEVDFKFTR